MKQKLLFASALLASMNSMQAVPRKGNAQKNKKPNIIYILADDLGRSELGCYGQQLIETPNLDALARQGMVFSNHYSGTAVSAPSRCILFTGLHSGHAYIRGNHEMGNRGDVWNHEAMLADSTLEGQLPMPAHTITIPAMMKKAGYITACAGKWGLGYPGSESTPNKMGFDFFYGYNCQRQAHTYYPPFLYRNECREYLKNDVRPTPSESFDKSLDAYDERNYAKYTKEEYSPDLIYKEMVDFVNRSKEKPFVLFWTTTLPHTPLAAPERWVKHYQAKFGDEKPFLSTTPSRYPHATYAAMVSYLDEQVGSLIAELKRLGLYENTLILFSSDNGPAAGGGTDSPWFDSAKPFRSDRGWGKTSLREGGIRTPLIASWPGKIKAGSQSDLISAFWDMMPTFCDIAGVDSPETDGISMLPTFLGEDSKQVKHDFLYWEYSERGGEKAVRMGKWKAYIQNIYKGNKEVELYNLELDPREQTNVARYHPELVKKAKEIMKREHTQAEIERFNMPDSF